MNISNKILPFLALMIFAADLYAQRRVVQSVVRVCGEYIYEVPGNIPLDQARRLALEGARTKALEDRFGTTMTLSVGATTQSSANEETEWFSMTNISEVNGEWLEDSGTPRFEESFDNQGRLIFKVNICGNARELTGTRIDLSTKILRNGVEARFESTDFRDGDEMYLAFRAPVDGFLAVYLVDESRTAYCLLPYMRDRTGRVEIAAGKDYVFFSARNAERTEAAIVDEYILTCEKTVEHDLMYIVFSPNEFTKANDAPADQETIPRQLPFDDFQNWLTRNRLRDRDMMVDIRTITIRK